jgi:hypothetical protein
MKINNGHWSGMTPEGVRQEIAARLEQLCVSRLQRAVGMALSLLEYLRERRVADEDEIALMPLYSRFREVLNGMGHLDRADRELSSLSDVQMRAILARKEELLKISAIAGPAMIVVDGILELERRHVATIQESQMRSGFIQMFEVLEAIKLIKEPLGPVRAMASY